MSPASIAVEVQAFDASTRAVFDAVYDTQASATVPVSANAITPPGGSASPVPVQTNRVPDPGTVSTASENPAGSDAPADAIGVGSVSVRVMASMVAVPMLTTLSVYVATCPMFGVSGLSECCSCTVNTSGNPAGFALHAVEDVGPVAVTYGVFETTAGRQESPTRPVRVNVKSSPGFIPSA